MTLRTTFFGSPEDFEAQIRSLGIQGKLEEQPYGVFYFRTARKGGVHWSSTRGTLWCDGKMAAQLASVLDEAFEDEDQDDSGPGLAQREVQPTSNPARN